MGVFGYLDLELYLAFTISGEFLVFLMRLVKSESSLVEALRLLFLLSSLRLAPSVVCSYSSLMVMKVDLFSCY